MLSLFLDGRCWTQQRTKLMAQPALRSAVLDCLLLQILPALAARMEAAAAAGISWEAVQPVSMSRASAVYFSAQGAPKPGRLPEPAQGEAWLGGLLHRADTRPLSQLHGAAACVVALLSPEGIPCQAAVGLMPTVARMAAALPPQCPAAMPPRAFFILHGSALSLLSLAADAISREAARQLAQPQSASTRAALSDFVAIQLSPAVWTVIRLVPSMACTLCSVATGLPAAADDFSTLAALVDQSLQLLSHSRGARPIWQVGSWGQLSAWAAAADAGLRLPPLLMVSGSSGQPEKALRLPGALLGWLALGGARSAVQWCSSNSLPPDDSHQALSSQMWQLHSSVARLVHYWAGTARDQSIEGHRQAVSPALQFELLRLPNTSCGVDRSMSGEQLFGHAQDSVGWHGLSRQR